jgi:hypothetical protein
VSKPKNIIVCVPVATHPDFPKKATYSHYSEAECDGCKQKVWLGERSKALADSGVTKLCPLCLMDRLGNNPLPPLKSLTKKDA